VLSICIFGSQARRTADSMSDRDVLLVGPPSRALDMAASRWAQSSWNVSVFERGALERLADVKALFLQHLKLEGRLILDDGNFLKSLLNSYSPKEDYSGERNDALAQIDALPCDTDKYWQQLCVADILYVLFRNAAILHLAGMNEYHFQFDVLVEKMGDIFNLSLKERKSLLDLRNLKHGYRHRTVSLLAMPCIIDARQAITKIAEQLLDKNYSSITDGVTTDKYFNIRMTEFNLVSQHDPRVLDEIGSDSDLFSVWQRIKSSGGYPKPPR